MSKEFQEFLELINQVTDPETGYIGMSRQADEYLKNGTHSTEFMEEFITLDLGFHGRSYNSTLAENPSITKAIIDKLVLKSSHRWEWRSLSSFYNKQLELAAIDVKADYPSELINITFDDAEKAVLTVHSAMSYIAEDMWNDLGLAGLLSLTYVPDNEEGDHFGPESIIESPAEYVLSPGFNCNWIENTRSLVIDRVLESAEENWVYEEDWSDDLSSDFNKAAVLVNALYSGEISTFNEKLVKEYIEQFEYNDEYFETEMELLEFPEDGLRYKNLSAEQQKNLVSNLIIAHNNDVFLRHFEITSHLLNLIAVHPKTDGAVLESIYSDQDVKIAKGKELRKITSGGGSI